VINRRTSASATIKDLIQAYFVAHPEETEENIWIPLHIPDVMKAEQLAKEILEWPSRKRKDSLFSNPPTNDDISYCSKVIINHITEERDLWKTSDHYEPRKRRRIGDYQSTRRTGGRPPRASIESSQRQQAVQSDHPQ